MITINAPDGSSVTFPDGTPEGTINQVMSEKFAPEAQDSFAGSAKAVGSGFAHGVASLAGLPGDAIDLAVRGFDYATGKNTHDGSIAKGIGSERFLKAIEGVTGELPKPQTTLEKYLHTTAGLAPMALAGPGGVARRVATQVVAPGVASEAAGQLADGTGYEPVARIVGGLGGAVGASKIASAATAGKGIAAVPTAAENAAFKSANYQGPATKALEINPTYAEKVVDAAKANLQRQKFSVKDPETATVYGLLDGLKVPEFGKTHKIADFDNTRRRLNEIAGSTGSGAEAARQAIRTIDAATLRFPKSAVVAGDARAASKELFDARKAAAVGFRSDKITKVLDDAMNTAVATHSGANLENEIYKQVRTMLKNPRVHLRGWSAEEKDALRAVLPDTVAKKGLRRVGKLMGGGGGLGQLASGSAGAAMFGPLGMFALPAIGMSANKAGSMLATNRLNKVGETLMARSPLYSKADQAKRQAALSGGVLNGMPTREQLAFQGLLAARLQLPDYARQ